LLANSILFLPCNPRIDSLIHAGDTVQNGSSREPSNTILAFFDWNYPADGGLACSTIYPVQEREKYNGVLVVENNI
jgi:hypothetical protein